MRRPSIARDIVPIAEFKTNASRFLRRVHESGRPLVVTLNGRPTAVVLAPEEFDELDYRDLVRAKIKAGIESAKTRTYSSAQVRKRLLSRVRRAR